MFHGAVVGRKVFLRLRPRRFYGASCKKAFTETFPGVETCSRVRTDLHPAAKRHGVGDGVVPRVLKRRVMGEVPIEAAFEGVSQAVLAPLRRLFKDRQEAAELLDRIIFNTQDASDVAMVQWGRTLKGWARGDPGFP